MNRIVVKNLPKFISREEIEMEFKKHGDVTDVYMVVNYKGVFRRVCFIGYKTNDEAKTALEYRNNSLLYNHKINVDYCTDEIQKTSNKTAQNSVERKAFYNRSFYVKNLQNIDEAVLREEFTKCGKISELKIEEKGIYVKFIKGEDALDFVNNKKVLCGRRIKIQNYNSELNQIKKDHFNTLFFDFKSVTKNISEIENIDKEIFVKLDDKSLGVKMAILETMLVQKTFTFLRENGIDLKNISGLDKKCLILRTTNIFDAIDLIKITHKASISPSRNLALIEFNDEKDAEKIQKSLNLKKYKDGIIYAEYAPNKSEIKTEKEIKTVDKKVKQQNKLCIKNLPFQVTKEEINSLFSYFVKVVDVRIPIKETGESRGFCFVTFDNENTVDKIIELFGISTHLYGRKLVLEKAQK